MFVYQGGTPKWPADAYKVLFPITRLLKIAGLQNFAQSFHFIFSAKLYLWCLLSKPEKQTALTQMKTINKFPTPESMKNTIILK